ncbi:hypothetical protein P775_27135 [Puniceibacterium antarcticum]|uniref:Thiamine biosynthesis protein ApbE n=1 Tax=Puniceibacterium antarcticum TaxID=1206336 RepID=A0A2G8QWI5_9RHOB|nr:UPF0280 family protein [Puniceibacterium antarcticum]PIL13639.1 hypothetical protein P775_27135 [Puniceibacterium antarcticum]
MGPVAALLPGDRLHLQHGPIDLIIGADGDWHAAFAAARARFASVLDELVSEMDLLRRPVAEVPRGAIARCMSDAVRPHADGIVTPMAAVAGSVAQTVLAAMVAATPLTRAYVNNGGDIALHLTGAETFRLAVAAPDGMDLGRIAITAQHPVRGIATSGQGGRSLSLGIADAVTVLARSASQADVAATLIGNAVDLPDHDAITRTKAREVQPDSDLRDHLVVTRVGTLRAQEVDAALDRGLSVAQNMAARGLIQGAALFLRGAARMTGLPESEILQGKTLTHA